MKFDFCIGNPPYQEAYEGESSGANSVYDKFLDNAFEIADKVEMIHPARFLFNAGSTPKAWNEKMLSDDHFKILKFESDSDKMFPMLPTPITGGVAISYRDSSKKFGEIGIFTQFDELNSIIQKIEKADDFKPISDVMVSSFAYHFTEQMHKDHPKAASKMSKGHAYDLKSSVFERLSFLFSVKPKDDGRKYVGILGRKDGERTVLYTRRDYINNVINLDYYKVFLGKADGAAGMIGNPIPARIAGQPVVGCPGMGSTESFLSIGKFNSKYEADSCAKYVKTKFARTLLGVLKVTQDITPTKWKYVPIQNFTDKSDINWNTSIKNIDKQLYKKYGLSKDEIDFIETHVKEME